MARVTLAPDMLFLSTWDTPERTFLGDTLMRLRAGSGYATYVEPIAGAYALATVTAEYGWPAREMALGDTSLFACVIGRMLAGEPLEGLDVCLDGERLPLRGASVEKAAQILFVQLLARLEKKSETAIFWEETVADLMANERRHLKSIADGLARMHQRLAGITFTQESPWELVERHADDPTAVIVSNPPTYKGAYEKFFDTDDRLTWEGPMREIWDPKEDQVKLAGLLRNAKALAIVQQQTTPRASAAEPIYARHLSAGQYVYLWCNRPDEVFVHTGGPKVRPRNPADITPLDRPTLPDDWEFREDAEVAVLPVSNQVASWYKQRWLHRLVGAEGAYNFAVILDGYVAGVGGYSFKAIQTPYPGVDAKVWAGATILRFACGAPHVDHRVTRLVTKVALQRESLMVIAKSLPSVMLMAAGSDKFVTTEYSRHPEAKGLRGLMKLVERVKDARDGYRLIYFAPMGQLTFDEAYQQWLSDDLKWLEKRRALGR